MLKCEVGRLTQENSQLRHDLLGEADTREAQERAHYQAVKQLEGQLTAVQFARDQTLQRLARLEKENNGLKQKASTLLSIGQQCSTGACRRRERGRARVAPGVARANFTCVAGTGALHPA